MLQYNYLFQNKNKHCQFLQVGHSLQSRIITVEQGEHIGYSPDVTRTAQPKGPLFAEKRLFNPVEPLN